MILGIFAEGSAQRNFSLGGGYMGSSLTAGGFLLEAEFDKVHSEQFSIPLQLHSGFYTDRERKNVPFANLHRGYRLTFQNGLFVKHSFGLGAMLSFYKEYQYYESENGNGGMYPNGRGWDLLPSVTFGAGYKVAWKNGATGRFWCRPKFALQLGYSHVIK